MTSHSVTIDMAPPDCADLPKRVFRLHGTEWTVCERTGQQGAALVFYAPGVARRVTRYPAHWQEIPVEVLYELSWQR